MLYHSHGQSGLEAYPRNTGCEAGIMYVMPNHRRSLCLHSFTLRGIVANPHTDMFWAVGENQRTQIIAT